MNEKIVIVVPTKNEGETINKFIESFNRYTPLHDKDIDVVIVDDTNDDSVRTPSIDAEFMYLKGCGNYGDSLINGMMCAELMLRCDKMIVMDIDHPLNRIEHIIRLLDVYDVVIGNDLNKGLARRFTGFLCNRFLGLDLSHPTCGYIGFKRNAVDYLKATSKHDIIHVEWMKEARNNNRVIGEFKFNTGSYTGKPPTVTHDYTIKRCVIWMVDFIKLYRKFI